MLQSVTPLALTAGGGGYTAQFSSPIVVNNITTTRILFGFQDALYESTNQGQNITALAPAFATNDGSIHHALFYGGTTGGVTNPDLIYARSGATVYRRWSTRYGSIRDRGLTRSC
ncbi:MAG TPA: hypothetical protein VMT61_01485 [Candidatus Binataceae bacterium]|nr:hypothetical protein [Candidatus Binataceae bacterium]